MCLPQTGSFALKPAALKVAAVLTRAPYKVHPPGLTPSSQETLPEAVTALQSHVPEPEGPSCLYCCPTWAWLRGPSKTRGAIPKPKICLISRSSKKLALCNLPPSVQPVQPLLSRCAHPAGDPLSHCNSLFWAGLRDSINSSINMLKGEPFPARTLVWQPQRLLRSWLSAQTVSFSPAPAHSWHIAHLCLAPRLRRPFAPVARQSPHTLGWAPAAAR